MSERTTATVDIPVTAGERIAKSYGYDQVVIVARKVGAGGREHVTTYGIDKVHCDVAARMGNFFKHKLMGWPAPEGHARDELQSLLDALLRMIPDYCHEHGVEQITDAEHNAAIERAAVALYGADRTAWPHGVRAVAEGRYE